MNSANSKRIKTAFKSEICLLTNDSIRWQQSIVSYS